jgi:3-deoxy-manno-octulosonate cytidylyltransferase (CMP-KDO synthetase)
MGSSRFPGKPMVPILGVPMIGHCYFRTRLSGSMTSTYVATCDENIVNYIESIGGSAVMTSKSHVRATSRTVEALKLIESDLGEKFDIVVMVQGDEPLVQPSSIDRMLQEFSDPSISVVNLMSPIYSREAFIDSNNVKVVTNQCMDALFFSRQPIPYCWSDAESVKQFMQTGIIAFRRESLHLFEELPESPLERCESVDMNRFLEHSIKVRMVPIDCITIGVDTPDELLEAEKHLSHDETSLKYLPL